MMANVSASLGLMKSIASLIELVAIGDEFVKESWTTDKVYFATSKIIDDMVVAAQSIVSHPDNLSLSFSCFTSRIVHGLSKILKSKDEAGVQVPPANSEVISVIRLVRSIFSIICCHLEASMSSRQDGTGIQAKDNTRQLCSVLDQLFCAASNFITLYKNKVPLEMASLRLEKDQTSDDAIQTAFEDTIRKFIGQITMLIPKLSPILKYACIDSLPIWISCATELDTLVYVLLQESMFETYISVYSDSSAQEHNENEMDGRWMVDMSIRSGLQAMGQIATTEEGSSLMIAQGGLVKCLDAALQILLSIEHEDTKLSTISESSAITSVDLIRVHENSEAPNAYTILHEKWCNAIFLLGMLLRSTSKQTSISIDRNKTHLYDLISLTCVRCSKLFAHPELYSALYDSEYIEYSNVGIRQISSSVLHEIENSLFFLLNAASASMSHPELQLILFQETPFRILNWLEAIVAAINNDMRDFYAFSPPASSRDRILSMKHVEIRCDGAWLNWIVACQPHPPESTIQSHVSAYTASMMCKLCITIRLSAMLLFNILSRQRNSKDGKILEIRSELQRRVAICKANKSWDCLCDFLSPFRPKSVDSENNSSSAHEKQCLEKEAQNAIDCIVALIDIV